MNAKDKYNGIIDGIETLVADREVDKPGKIAEKIARQAGCSERDLSSTFSFLTGLPLISYIRERQMMAAYRSILDSDEIDLEYARMFTNHSDQPAFNNSFRQYFQMTPTEAFQRKDDSLYRPAMEWSVISDGSVDIERRKEDDAVSATTKFGIEKSKLQRITEALDCQVLYEFTEVQSDVAFALAEKLNAPMKACFEFVDDFCLQHYADENGNVELPDAEKLRKMILASGPLAAMCISFDLSFAQAMETLVAFSKTGIDLATVDYDIIELYLNCELDIEPFWYAYNWAKENGVEAGEMPDFLHYYENYHDLQTAYDLATGEAFNEMSRYYPDDDKKELVTGYEWERGETDFSAYDRFDEDFDEDNAAYDDSDPEDMDMFGYTEDFDID